MRYDALELYDWSDWDHVEYLEPWQWAALSVKLPPTKEGIAEAAEHACGELWNTDQGGAYINRRAQLEAAIGRGEVLAKQISGPFTPTDQLQWAKSDEKIPAESFVAWALHQKLELPPELMRRRSYVSKKDLMKKYIGKIKNISSIFKNQGYSNKTGSNRITLAEMASRKEKKKGACEDEARPTGHGMWDEFSFLLWLRLESHI